MHDKKYTRSFDWGNPGNGRHRSEHKLIDFFSFLLDMRNIFKFKCRCSFNSWNKLTSAKTLLLRPLSFHITIIDCHSTVWQTGVYYRKCQKTGHIKSLQQSNAKHLLKWVCFDYCLIEVLYTFTLHLICAHYNFFCFYWQCFLKCKYLKKVSDSLFFKVFFITNILKFYFV